MSDKVLHEFTSGHPRMRFRLVGDRAPALQVCDVLGSGDGWSYVNTGCGHYVADLLSETVRLSAELLRAQKKLVDTKTFVCACCEEEWDANDVKDLVSAAERGGGEGS